MKKDRENSTKIHRLLCKLGFHHFINITGFIGPGLEQCCYCHMIEVEEI